MKNIDWNAEALAFMRSNNVCPQDVVMQAISKAMQKGFEMGKIEMAIEASLMNEAAAKELEHRRKLNIGL